MSRYVMAAAGLVALAAGAGATHGQQCAGHCSQWQSTYGPSYSQAYRDSYYENKLWPNQYVAPSRRAICQAFQTQVNNGWRRNNLLGKYDFAPNGEGLSEAGRLRVEWILTTAPPQHRTIFVQRGVDPAQTAGRVAAVQTLAASMTPAVEPVAVQETYMADYGRPASSVDAVFTGFGANQPAPVLPAAGGGSSSEGS